LPLRQASIRAALAAVLALAVAPDGFTVAQFTTTVAQFTTKMAAMTGQTDADYTTRQGACDLRKLRGKQLVAKPGRTWRYHVPEAAARTIAALLTIRDQVIARLLAGARTPRGGAAHRSPGPGSTATTRLCASTCNLFQDLGLTTAPAAA